MGGVRAPHTLCLERGSLIFLPDDGTARVHAGKASQPAGTHDTLNSASATWLPYPNTGAVEQSQNAIADNSGTMYEIQKIYMAKPTILFPDYTQTIVLDKNV